MSKIYKSSNIHIGAPKPIKNIFLIETKPKPKDDESENAVSSPEDEAKAMAESIIEEAKQMYLQIIDEANNEAKKTIDDAFSDADNIRTEAYESGFKSGHQDANENMQGIIEQASDLRDFLDRRKEELLKELEVQIIDLIVDSTKKIIGNELLQNQNAIFSLIKQALSKCAIKNKMTIRVSENDFEKTVAGKESIMRVIEGLSDLEIVKDLSLNTGGCIIETASGEINASTDVQIKELEKAFLFTLRNE